MTDTNQNLKSKGETSHWSRGRKVRRGGAAVETAVCLPILIILVLGIAECNDSIFLRQGLLVSAFEGARVAIVPGAKTENVETKIKQILAERQIQGAKFEIQPKNFEKLSSGSLLTVTVRAPVEGNSSVGISFFKDRQMSGSVTMMTEY